MDSTVTETGVLHPRAPFDFTQTLAFSSGFRPAQGDQQTTAQALTRAILVDGQTITFRLTSRGSVEAPLLEYTLYSDQPIAAETRALVEDRLRFFLSLDDDLTPFYCIGRDDPRFAPLIDLLYGYHQVKFMTPFENAVWAVLSQRNQMPVTLKMKQALTERYGSTLAVDGRPIPAFPEPARLAVAPPDEVAAVIGHGPKGRLIPGVARAFDQMDEHWLRDAPYDDVERWLRTIRGIGAWSAAFVLLRGLGRMERLPAGDKWIQQAVARTYGLISVTDEDIARLGAPYGPWIGYWAHYLRAAA